MKKFLVMILAGIFCFSALAFAGCDKAPEQTNNTLKYKEEKLVFTLDKEIFSATVEEMTALGASKDLLSSKIWRITDKDEIKDFLNKTFNGKDSFNFAEITENQYLENFTKCSTITVYGSDSKQFTFYLYNDGNKAYYADSENEVYYQADTGDLSALYETYMRY
ncbi:MAG: hypothetical protein IJU83_04850 [Clostridia bacterium]|nr:hypothetical protein [Clostridia bacterium]